MSSLLHSRYPLVARNLILAFFVISLSDQSIRGFSQTKSIETPVMASKHYFSSAQKLVNKVMAAMLQHTPFPITTSPPWTVDNVRQILRSVPRFFFQPPRSIGRQKGFRHRSPLKQTNLYNLRTETEDSHMGASNLTLGAEKALQFYYWVESQSGFAHCESTCREMALVLAKAHELRSLWGFLREMSQRSEANLVTRGTVTCVIKALGEEGLVKEALNAFYRMKQFRCKPDVYAFNTVICALCRVGYFKKARFLLEQMELPGFRCPPDVYTYTIFITFYCKRSLQTGCRKAIRRRLWEANHLFRVMIFKGFTPDVVTYNCLIDGCCKTYRIGRALELFDDMPKRGCVPNRVTYNSFIRYYSVVNEIDKAIEMMRRMKKMNHGVPTSSSYTPIIHALCEAGRVVEARDFLVQLVEQGSIPREYTYKLVCAALSSAGEPGLSGELQGMIKYGIERRSEELMKVKLLMTNCIL